MARKPRYVFQYGDTVISYRVRTDEALSGRVRIHVEPDGEVIVETPPDCTEKAIREAMRAKARWVYKQLREVALRKRNALQREYVSGESHFYLGRRYMLKVSEATSTESPGVKLSGAFLKVWVDGGNAQNRREAVRTLLDQWYKERATAYIARRLLTLCETITWLKAPPLWSLRPMKKQWGSCSSLKRLYINLNVIKAPGRCVDYVLLHELCHLREGNHSARFYRFLKKHCPWWEEAKGVLDGLAEQLLCE